MGGRPGSRVPGTGSRIDRRTLLATALSGTTATAGCLAGAGSGLGEDSGEERVDEVAMVSSPAGFDDDAFNDEALAGLQEAASEYGFGIRTIQATQPERYESVQADAAEEGHDLVVCASDYHTDALSTNAATYPDQNWMLINNAIQGADNVSGWIERNDQLSFLAGVVAGTMTGERFHHNRYRTDPESATVGFVGGEESDLLRAFERSYVEGARWANEDVEVLSGYGGSFEDPAGADRVASAQIDDGADVVWHAAAGAGEGVFAAADRRGRFALGVDTDQSVAVEEYADVILGSAVKAVDSATYRVAKAVVEDEFEEVVGERTLSVANGGVGFVVGREFEDRLPEGVLEAVGDAEDALEEGRVDLSCGPTGC
ncbi:BMP family protein [Saliphagus sp. LR7]|uniref:BMP family lipoprotein n=1 Tax=Saliphagus sp. LR7 TaxID=2282654 RepID=UPI000DF797A7|nr:BMP family ABC transporter substrate-binding protein [Saliphagus sp. LR7]